MPASTTASPEEQIRRYLEDQGGWTDATVRHLLVTFGVPASDEQGRKRIMASLWAAGMDVVPALFRQPAEARVRVTLVADSEDSRQPPAVIARHNVKQNGGSYDTSVPDLLALFGRRHLTDRTRDEIRAALADVGVGVEPALALVGRDDAVRLYRSKRRAVGVAAFGPEPVAAARILQWLRPRARRRWA